MDSEAQLPLGSPTTLQGISENFAFHASPESFIADRVVKFAKQNESVQRTRRPIRAKILNRNVAILSAYDDVNQVLNGAVNQSQDSPTYVAHAPYRQLMEAFFPSPNLLLSDGCPHRERKAHWIPLMDSVRSDATRLHRIMEKSLEYALSQDEADLYAQMKRLASCLIIGTFYEVDPGDKEFSEVAHEHDLLLRGQFSLLPVSFSVGSLWSSPRKIGIGARAKLQDLIRKKILTGGLSWLPRELVQHDVNETINHVLMFTSSLAVKGLASALTAVLCNTFLRLQCSGIEHLRLDGMTEDDMRSLIEETLRLSPPIVGVMRRSTIDTVIKCNDTTATHDTRIPKGWDVWCYFPAANRDRRVYGEDADAFKLSRFLDPATMAPFVFGAGDKTCLGADVIRRYCLTVLQTFKEKGIGLNGSVEAQGVRAWLGWEEAGVEAWARDMKQLPTQRPSKPILVRFSGIQ